MADRAEIQTEIDLFSVLERGEAVTQLALSKDLSVSVGLINALLKRAAKRGLTKARAVPPGRWAYYLTPKGFAEKSKLVAAYLDNSLAFFRKARAEYVVLFERLRRAGVGGVALVGRGELAEIAILAAQEVGIEIVGILDSKSNGERLYGVRILRYPDEVDASIAMVITDVRSPQATFDKVQGRYGARRIESPAFLRISAAPLEGAQL